MGSEIFIIVAGVTIFPLLLQSSDVHVHSVKLLLRSTEIALARIDFSAGNIKKHIDAFPVDLSSIVTIFHYIGVIINHCRNMSQLDRSHGDSFAKYLTASGALLSEFPSRNTGLARYQESLHVAYLYSSVSEWLIERRNLFP